MIKKSTIKQAVILTKTTELTHLEIGIASVIFRIPMLDQMKRFIKRIEIIESKI